MRNMWTILTTLVLIHQAAGAIVNVALNKPASMSSFYGHESLHAAGAVDGNITSRWPNIIHTEAYKPFAWWKVDLQREVQDATVRIYFRTDYKYSRNGVNLYTSTRPFPYSDPTRQGQLCYTVTGSLTGSDIPDVVSSKCPGRWRYLLVYTDTDNDGNGALLDFGEVEVYTCVPLTYGVNCSKSCSSRHCVTSSPVCDSQTGLCGDGCESGWTGVDCTHACSPGVTYGVNCEESCSSRHCVTSSSSCDAQTGHCLDGCEPGWTEVDCTQPCSPGVTYGVNCGKSCSSRHCVTSSPVCEPQSGQCSDGCEVGWTGVDCSQECPAGTFGSDCTSCSTRHCQGESDCPADGTCSQGCQDGWTGNICRQECPSGLYGPGCSMKCGNCSSGDDCHHVTGNCPSGCNTGWASTKCDKVTTNERDSTHPSVGSVVGSAVGSILLVVLLLVAMLICLVRQGRLQWVKVSGFTAAIRVSRVNAQRKNVTRPPADLPEHAHSSSHLYSNAYAVLDVETKVDSEDYDAIQHNLYKNI